MERLVAPFVHVLVHKIVLLILHCIVNLIVAIGGEGVAPTSHAVLQLVVVHVLYLVDVTFAEAFMTALQLRATVSPTTSDRRASGPVDRLRLASIVTSTGQNRVDCLSFVFFSCDLTGWHGLVTRLRELALFSVQVKVLVVELVLVFHRYVLSTVFTY